MKKLFLFPIMFMILLSSALAFDWSDLLTTGDLIYDSPPDDCSSLDGTLTDDGYVRYNCHDYFSTGWCECSIRETYDGQSYWCLSVDKDECIYRIYSCSSGEIHFSTQSVCESQINSDIFDDQCNPLIYTLTCVSSTELKWCGVGALGNNVEKIYDCTDNGVDYFCSDGGCTNNQVLIVDVETGETTEETGTRIPCNPLTNENCDGTPLDMGISWLWILLGAVVLYFLGRRLGWL